MRALILLPVLLMAACATVAPSRTPPPAPDVTDSAATRTQAPDPSDHDPSMRASSPPSPPMTSPVSVPLDTATLASLPREAITATAHGRTVHCDGIPLLALLRASAAMPAGALRGPQLTRYVQVDARDGYRVVYALAEIDPTLGNHKVFVTDRCDGKPLADDDGPLRLIAPDEARPARWVRQLKSITVIVAP